MEPNDQAGLVVGSSIGDFRITESLDSSNELRLFRAVDERLGRSVLVRFASGGAADGLRVDARRIAAVAHHSLVPILAIADHAGGVYVATPDIEARPLREVIADHPLTPEQAAGVTSDIAGAVEALAHDGTRARLDLDTILLGSAARGARAFLDPLRGGSNGGSRLAQADGQASTVELAGLLGEVATGPGGMDQTREARPRRRVRILVAVGLAALALVVAAVALHRRGTGSSDTPERRATAQPAALVAARIPLGLAPNEQGRSIAIRGDTIWIATNVGTVVRVDGARNEVVGTPVTVGGSVRQIHDIVATRRAIYATDYGGWLLRLDPRTGQTTGRLHLGTYLGPIRAEGGVLWLTRSFSSGPAQLLRVSEATMRTIGAPIELPIGTAFSLVVRGQVAWIAEQGLYASSVTRVDIANRRQETAHFAGQPVDIARVGSTLWVTGYTDGMVVPVDAVTMAFEGEAVHVKRAPIGIGSGGGDVWVAAQDAVGSSTSTMYRLDGSSGRRVGRAVAIPATPLPALGDAIRVVSGLGSIWTTAGGALLRLSPTSPRPALVASSQRGTPPRAIQSGPLAGGLWKSVTFAPPFTFRVSALDWEGLYPLADSIALVTSRNADNGVWVSAPRQVFVTDTDQRPVRGADGLVALLRSNPHLQLGAIHRVALGRRRAVEFSLTTRNLTVNDTSPCGEPCVALFALQLTAVVVDRAQVNRMTILESRGRTVAILESADTDAGLEATGRLVRTLRFAA